MPMLLNSPTFTIPQSIMTIMGNAGLFRDQRVHSDPDAGMMKLDLQNWLPVKMKMLDQLIFQHSGWWGLLVFLIACLLW